MNVGCGEINRRYTSDNDVFVFELRVMYGNGQAESIPVREEIKNGRRSRVIDLAGRARFLNRVELLYRSDRTGNRCASINLFGIKFAPLANPARTNARRKQRRTVAVSTAPALQWQLLGTQSVQRKLDRDRVMVGKRAGQYRAVQLFVRESNIEFEDLTVVFGNGRVQDVPVRSLIRAESSTRVIDLRGKNRVIREIQFTYKRPENSFNEYMRAAVDVYGLQVEPEFAGRVTTTSAPRTSGQTKAHTEVGVLNCEVSDGVGFVIGSSKELTCRFNRPGLDERYFGTIEKFGLDIGATTQGVLSWAVLARTTDVPPGALSGNCVGVSAQATLGAGVGANALVGGSKRSILLQPLSVQAQLGLNLALGVTEMKLRR